MTEKLSVLTKFNNFVEKLDTNETRDLYFVLTALRGPDFYDELGSLKSKTTSRIRSFISKKLMYHCSVIRNPINNKNITSRNKRLKIGFRNHFAEHYKKAVEVIKRTEHYDLETEEKVCQKN